MKNVNTLPTPVCPTPSNFDTLMTLDTQCSCLPHCDTVDVVMKLSLSSQKIQILELNICLCLHKLCGVSKCVSK